MNSSKLTETIGIGNTSTNENRKSVTIIGLGPMGQAMAGAFLERGYAVTVWNRTSSKADELVANGAVRASTVIEAIAANELVILSLTDYDVMYDILKPAMDYLSGKVLVNLSSDTPKKVREAAEWVTNREASHITGGVQVPPSGIGKLESSTYYSGPREIFETIQKDLEVLTSTDYRGEDPGLAMLYYQIQMDIFWTSMLSYLHGLAVAGANGITAEQFLPYASATLSSLPGFVEFYTPRLNAGKHPGDVDRLAMGLASVEHVVHTTEEAGIDITLPAAVLKIFKRGMDNDHATDSFTSLIEIFKNSN